MPKPESSIHQRIDALHLCRSEKQDMEKYVGVGEKIADLVCRARESLRSTAAALRRTSPRRRADPSA